VFFVARNVMDLYLINNAFQEQASWNHKYKQSIESIHNLVAVRKILILVAVLGVAGRLIGFTHL
jgi:hypothetical protein